MLKSLFAATIATTLATTVAGAFATTPALAAEHKTSSDAAQERIRTLVDSDTRPAKQRARDQYRRPFETLTFCGVEPEMTVVEIWPGGQGAWYRRIIEPLVSEGGGAYHAAPGRGAFPDIVEGVPYGGADMVFVFRAHGFMIYDQPAQTHVNAVYDMLKPDGVLCIVDHAGDENIPQDPEGKNGYVNESHFRKLAETAGLVFLAASEHNRNPKDTKDHPRGVWSLPPALSRSVPGTPQRKKYLEIGESDRFTHKYYKPAE